MKSPIGPVPSQRVAAVGLYWFSEPDYAATLAVMDDRHVLPPTYAEWLAKAENGERELVRGGHQVIRAIIDPKTFPKWCMANGFDKIDARARTLWGAEHAARQIGL